MTQQQAFPQLNTPVIQQDGRVSIPWYKFFISLWQKAGSAYTPVVGSVALQNTGSGIEAIDATSGASLGFLITTGAPGAVIPIPQGVSPQTYVPASPGTLVVAGAQVELSRDSGVTWYLASPNGGSFPLLFGDRARMTWYGADPLIPKMSFWPSSI